MFSIKVNTLNLYEINQLSHIQSISGLLGELGGTANAQRVKVPHGKGLGWALGIRGQLGIIKWPHALVQLTKVNTEYSRQ